MACSSTSITNEGWSFQAAMSSNTTPVWYTETHEKMFSLFALSPVEARSTYEPHNGSKDVHPQASASFHTWPWPWAMGRCPYQGISLILDAACHEEKSRSKKKKLDAIRFLMYVSYFSTPANIQAPELEFSLLTTFPKRKRFNLKLSSIRSEKQGCFSFKVFQAVCSSLGLQFFLVLFIL